MHHVYHITMMSGSVTLSLYLILHIYGVDAHTLILQDLQLMWSLLRLTQHDGGIRECSGVLYLGMARKISNWPSWCGSRIMAKEATTPQT